MNFLALISIALYLYFAHLIASRAKRSGRRYWFWFLLCLPGGPLGEVIVFLVLEAANNKRAEREVLEEANRENG